MSRILLVDDSPHALRMGERILGDEGHEVVALSNADSALIRLEDVDPDVVIADATMSGRSGYEICQYLKMNPRHRHARVILTVSSQDQIDEDQFQRSEADESLKKPFEATALLAAVKRLAEAALAARSERGAAPQAAAESVAPAAPFVAVVDPALVRAAVTVALDGAMESMVREISGRVMEALKTREASSLVPQLAEPEPPPVRNQEPPAPVAPLQTPGVTPRYTPFRKRSGSILGLSIDEPAEAAGGAKE
jgi:CheY-like chemotaxis protein